MVAFINCTSFVPLSKVAFINYPCILSLSSPPFNPNSSHQASGEHRLCPSPSPRSPALIFPLPETWPLLIAPERRNSPCGHSRRHSLWRLKIWPWTSDNAIAVATRFEAGSVKSINPSWAPTHCCGFYFCHRLLFCESFSGLGFCWI